MKVHLRQRKNKDSVVYFLDYFVKGERFREKVETINKTDSPEIKEIKKKKVLAAQSAKQKQLVLSGTGMEAQDTKNILFYPFIDTFMTRLKGSPVNTTRAVKNVLLKIYPDVQMTFGQVQENVNFIKAFRKYVEEHYNGHTISQYHVTLSRILNEAVRNKFLVLAPEMVIKNKLMKRGRRHRDLLFKEEIEALAAVGFRKKEVENAFLFAWHAGLGAQELRKIRSRHILTETSEAGTKHYLSFARTKNGEPLMMALPEKALKYVDLTRDYLFELPNNNTSLNTWLQEWAKAAGITKHISTYSFRHAYANHLVKQGASPVDLKVRMGWTTTAMYANYVQPDADKDERLAATL